MEAHVNADIITAKTVLDLSKRAKELFMSSKLGEKQQLLNFVFSNLKLDGKRLLVTLREPFLTLATMPHQPVSLQILGTLRTFDWLDFKDEFLSYSYLACYKSVENNVSYRIQ